MSTAMILLSLVCTLPRNGVLTPPVATTQPSPFRIKQFPQIRLQPPKPLSKSESDEIKRLITSIATIEHPFMGASPTMSGTAFFPIEGLESAGAFLLTNHGLKKPAAVESLVKLGPTALPMLLDSLTDATPTRIKIEWRTMMGSMTLDNELWGNPMSRSEIVAIESRGKKGDELFGEAIEEYTVKIGDVCFVAIAQIVGRPYESVRYQPSGNVIVNSPVENAGLANAVRSVWAAKDSRQHLFDSLIFDYSTEGIYKGGGMDEWYVASELQLNAATRLLYYFPDEVAELIAKRIHAFRVDRVGPISDAPSTPAELEAWAKREADNGVRTDDFLKAISWIPNPLIRQELKSSFFKSNDTDIVLAALPAIERNEDKLICERLTKLLDRVPPDDDGPFGEGYRLIVALGDRGGMGAKPVLLRFRDRKDMGSHCSLSHALRETRPEWAGEMLSPYLDDNRDTGGEYAIDPGKNGPRLPIRVCDEAAETIARAIKSRVFELKGTHEDLDRSIAELKKQLQKGKD